MRYIEKSAFAGAGITELSLDEVAFVSGGKQKATQPTVTVTDDLCPSDHRCSVLPGSGGNYVRDNATGTTYFSDKGLARYNAGADTNWRGVARDLAYIAGSSVGGAGTGVRVVIGIAAGVFADLTK